MYRIVRFLLGYCSILSSATLFGQSLSPELAAKIDSSFSTWNSTQSPGAVIGIVHRGQLIYQKSFGMANLSRQQALTINHQFWVASIAKQFTATCVALLAEQGKLRLDDDIRHYLPGLQTGNDTIRIRHLIDHTSGLRDGFTLIGLTLKRERHYTNQQVMAKLYRQQQLNFTPGLRHEYNNGGYVVLAELVTRVSGKPFADFAQEAIQGNYSHHVYAFSPDHKTLSPRSRAFDSTLERVDTAQPTVTELKRLTGRYYSPELGKVYRITRHKNTLRLSFFRLVHVPLLPLRYNQFLADLQGNNCLTFSNDTTGSVAGFTLSRDGVTKLRFVKR